MARAAGEAGAEVTAPDGPAAPARRLRGRVASAWRHPRYAPVARAGAAVVGLPLAINLVFARNPPLGIFLHGAVLGSLYGLVGMGLILVYRANKVISFAQAGLGAAPAVAALMLYTKRGLPYAVTLVLLLLLAASLGAIVDVVVVRRFRRAPRLILTVATIGVAQLLAFVELFTPQWVTGEFLPATEFRTPFTSFRFEIGDVFFSGDHVVTLVAVVALMVGLGAFLKGTRLGVAVRASAENGDRAMLVGIPVRRVSTVVWIIAAVLSAVGVFLRTPLVGLPLGGLIGPSILLYTLTVAVIARMNSLPLALFAGMAIGVIDQAVFYATRNATVSQAIMLPVILGALLVQRHSISRAEDIGASTWQSVREFAELPARVAALPAVAALRAAFRLGVVALVLAAPILVGELRRIQLTLLIIYAIMGVSLVILTGWAGQISLGQFAFAGVGAAVAGSLAAEAGWDFFAAVAVASVVGAALAVVVGLPALRVQGFYLAVATLAFAAATQTFFLNDRYFAWLVPETTAPIARPIFYGRIDTKSDFAYYYVCVVGLVVAVAVARAIRSSRTGRLLVAARDNPRAAQAYSINLARTRLVSFAAAGFLAGLAGGLYAYLLGSVDANVFSPTASIQIFAMSVIGGLTSPAGAIAGAAYVIGFQYLVPDYALLATGAGMLFLLLFFPGGLAEIGFRVRDRVAARSVRAAHGAGALEDGHEPSGEVGVGEASGTADWVICPVCSAPLSLSELEGHAHLTATSGNGNRTGARQAEESGSR